MRPFYINILKRKRKDFYFDKSSLTVELSGLHDLTKSTSMVMDKQSLRWAKSMLRKESKPLIIAMRGNINKSKKKITATLHRHYSKKRFTTLQRAQKPGQLKRSIGYISSKRFKDIPVGYVGNRKGVNTANDGYYGHFVEFGTQRGIKAQRWFKRAIQSVGDKVKIKIQENIFAHMGKKMEAGR
jgi:HK97 gp10 family phage protein